MNVIEWLRMAFCRGFSFHRASNRTPQTRVSAALPMLAVMMVCAPRVVLAQTFTYTGAALTPALGNSANCPVIANITGTITFNDSNSCFFGTLVAGPKTLEIASASSFLGIVDASGTVETWDVFAFSTLNPSDGAVTIKNGFGFNEDSFGGLFPDPGNPFIVLDCVYTNNTPGVWSMSPAVASPKNLGNGDPNADSSAPPCQLASNDAPGSLEGNPIDGATGNKYELETDITCAAYTGINLARFYNCQDTTSSPFGKNWDSTWHRGLAVNGNTVTVTRADGRQDTFTNNGSNIYTADPDVTSVLVPLSNNVPLTGVIGSPLTGWQLTLADDTVETYLVGGQLSTITSRAGLVTTLSYDANSNVTRVTARSAM
jgi:YD repeat-containing protein